MRRRIIAVLLEEKRKELKESKLVFSRRIYPDLSPQHGLNRYFAVSGQYEDIANKRIKYVAEVLGHPEELLLTI